MSDIIHLLPDSVANQIAAGEVVQRPSSIVKEMVENAIDAGADDIQVVIVDGGKTCVQVIDNGTGMSETDARMAFERHATSKIAKAQDIYNLSTMGFRGEALASIAAVAQVEMKTRRSEDEVGTLLQIDGAKVVEHKPVACPKGTNIAVRNLFFNIPVRRKFLKKTQTELNNIVQDFERIVLVYPELKFLLTHNDTPVFRLAKSNLKQRIADVYGARLADTLLPVQTETSLVSVTGFVGKPEDAKRKGAKQFFFVNGRFMKHQSIRKTSMSMSTLQKRKSNSKTSRLSGRSSMPSSGRPSESSIRSLSSTSTEKRTTSISRQCLTTGVW